MRTEAETLARVQAVLTPELGFAAYKKTGKLPYQGLFASVMPNPDDQSAEPVDCGCYVGVVCDAAGLMRSELGLAIRLGVPNMCIDILEEGFDRRPAQVEALRALYASAPVQLAAFNTGVAVWAAWVDGTWSAKVAAAPDFDTLWAAATALDDGRE